MAGAHNYQKRYEGKRLTSKGRHIRQDETKAASGTSERTELRHTEASPAVQTTRKTKKKKSNDLPSSSQLEAVLKHEQYRRRYSTVLRSTIYTLVVVAAIAVLVATLFLPVLQIYGSSMEPTVSAGDIVVSVKGAELKQGDVISFYYQNSVLVKRVIATSGDWVDIDADGNVYVNGKRLEEPYLTEKAYGVVTIDLPYQVPEGRVFVMGDHRSTSVDSRTEEVGCVAEEYLIGKITFRIWPLNRFGYLD